MAVPPRGYAVIALLHGKHIQLKLISPRIF
jgi:hypothetical protein